MELVTVGLLVTLGLLVLGSLVRRRRRSRSARVGAREGWPADVHDFSDPATGERAHRGF